MTLLDFFFGILYTTSLLWLVMQLLAIIFVIGLLYEFGYAAILAKRRNRKGR
jgi:hypothetical protein